MGANGGTPLLAYPKRAWDTPLDVGMPTAPWRRSGGASAAAPPPRTTTTAESSGSGTAPAAQPRTPSAHAAPTQPAQEGEPAELDDQGDTAPTQRPPVLVTNKPRNAERAYREAQRKQEKAEADLREFDRATAAAAAAAAAEAEKHRAILVDRIESAKERTRLREYRFDQAMQEMACNRGPSAAYLAANWEVTAEASSTVAALGPELAALAEGCKDNPEQYGRAQGLLAKLQGLSASLQSAVDGGYEHYDMAFDDDAMSDYSVADTPHPQPATPLAAREAPVDAAGEQGTSTARRKWSRTAGGAPFGHAAWSRQSAGAAEPSGDAPLSEEEHGPPRAKGARVHRADDMEEDLVASADAVAGAARQLQQAAQDPGTAERLRELAAQQDVQGQQAAGDEQLQRLQQQQADAERQAARAQAEAAAAAAATEQRRLALEH